MFTCYEKAAVVNAIINNSELTHENQPRRHPSMLLILFSTCVGPFCILIHKFHNFYIGMFLEVEPLDQNRSSHRLRSYALHTWPNCSSVRGDTSSSNVQECHSSKMDQLGYLQTDSK